MRKRKRIPKEVLEYNHIRVQFSDASEIHLLLTDRQVKKAIVKASQIGLESVTTWMHEIWLEGIVSICGADKTKDIRKYGLPSEARKVSHIRINLGGEILHLALEHSPLRSAIKRADNFDDLPKSSWLSDKFNGEKYEQQTKERQIAS